MKILAIGTFYTVRKLNLPRKKWMEIITSQRANPFLKKKTDHKNN